MFNFLFSACICSLLASPMDSADTGSRIDEVEVLELNHFFDENGKHVFDQLIFWATYPKADLHVRGWRLVKSKSMIPKKRGDKWETRWERNGVKYVVTARGFKETKTAFDPELRDRKAIPKDKRNNLFSGGAKLSSRSQGERQPR